MDYTWIAPNEVEEVLNPNYYRGIYLDATRKVDTLGNHNTIASISKKVSDGPFGSQLKTEEYLSAGIPLFRVSDVENLLVNLADIVYISAEKQKQLSRSKVIPGDILITKAGRIGSSAVIPQSISEANITSHLALIRLKDNIDPYFIAAFLESKYGRLLSERSSHKSTRPELTKTEVEKIPVFLPTPKIQAYIGDKVRLAEKCREMAQTKRSQIEYLLEQHAHKADITALLSAKPQPSHNIEAKIINDRLDAEFYQPHYLDLVQIIQARPYQKLGDVIQLPIKGVQPEYDSTGTVPALTGTDIDPYRLDLEGASRVNLEWAKGKTKALAVSNEILFTVTGPPLGEAAVVHSFQAPLVINSHVARIKTRQSFPYPFYLAALMNSIIVSAQVYRYCKGVRQKELYPEDIMQFVIPEVDIEIVRQINNLGYAADFLEYRASGLIREAIAEVENLIEGKLETSEIMASKLIAPTWEDIEHQLQGAHA